METIIDFSQFKFECLKCGKCCSNRVKKQKVQNYAYDFRGNFTYNPVTSIDIPYFEKQSLERKIFLKLGHKPRIVPLEAFFLKTFPIGFVFGYQFRVNGSHECFYLDLNSKKCKIYDVRPLSCRYYPLYFNIKDISDPLHHLECNNFDNKIKSHHEIRYGNSVKLRNLQTKKSFPYEFPLYLDIIYFILGQRYLIFEHLSSYLLDQEKVTPQKIKHYELKDFSTFFTWAYQNFTSQTDQLKLNMFRTDFYDLIYYFKKSDAFKSGVIELPF